MVLKQLPYKWLAGITPCPGGWLVAPARLAAVTVIVEDCMVMRTLEEVVDFRPKFDAAAINSPLGFPDEPSPDQYGACEAEARAMVGWPRRVAIRPIPSRAALNAATREEALAIEPWLTSDDFRRFRWLREAALVFQPFHQRSFFSANPELSYTLLNEDQPVLTSPFHEDGVIERMALVRNKLPGAEDLIAAVPPDGAGQTHVMQAVGLLWTARRAVGRAMNRLPLDPQWDNHGLRMELVR
jgi:predicted RNase H-like nuclease